MSDVFEQYFIDSGVTSQQGAVYTSRVSRGSEDTEDILYI